MHLPGDPHGRELETAELAHHVLDCSLPGSRIDLRETRLGAGHGVARLRLRNHLPVDVDGGRFQPAGPEVEAEEQAGRTAST